MKFNETELAIFKLQAGFELGKYYESLDGTACAVDEVNHKLFVGQDLLRVNVHDLDSLQSVGLDEGCTVNICLGKPQKTFCLKFTPEDAGALFEELNAFIPTEKAPAPHVEEAAPQTEKPASRIEDATIPAEKTETVSSRMDTEPRVHEEPVRPDNPIEEMVRNINEARQSIGELHNILFSVEIPGEVFETARTLKYGDRIHVEYKQMFGQVRGRFAVFSQFCCRSNSRSMSVFAKGGDYEEFKENLVRELIDRISINFVCDGDVSETNCKLSRITALRKLE